MTSSSNVHAMHAAPSGAATGSLLRSFVIALTAFLTVVDLFATQAILPSLAKAYDVSPAAIGFAVNASTIGMAVAGLAVAFFSNRIDRRRGVLASLTLLAVPTALLSIAPDLMIFAALRIAQGLCMSSAFALTLSYLAENCGTTDTAGAFAAYITGNVASNLSGRLMAAALVDHVGLAGNFYVFAALILGRVPAQRAATRSLRHRLLDSVRVHRHVHLRQLRSGARADRLEPHAARIRLLRVSAVDSDDSVGGARSRALRHTADP